MGLGRITLKEFLCGSIVSACVAIMITPFSHSTQKACSNSCFFFSFSRPGLSFALFLFHAQR